MICLVGPQHLRISCTMRLVRPIQPCHIEIISIIHFEEGKEKKLRTNANATMDVRSYEAGQDKKLKNKEDNDSGGIAKKVQDKRLKWYGHVMRREVHYIGRRAMVNASTGEKEEGKT